MRDDRVGWGKKKKKMHRHPVSPHWSFVASFSKSAKILRSSHPKRVSNFNYDLFKVSKMTNFNYDLFKVSKIATKFFELFKVSKNTKKQPSKPKYVFNHSVV